jgi:hypothetical protein
VPIVASQFGPVADVKDGEQGFHGAVRYANVGPIASASWRSMPSAERRGQSGRARAEREFTN